MIAITGGSCSGKTTLVDRLKKLGHHVLPESAIWVIDHLNSTLGLEGQKQWRAANFSEFQRMIACLDEVKFDIAKLVQHELTFWDRGVHDGIAYCKLAGVEVPSNLERLADVIQYNKVFVLRTLSNFSQRSETGRISDKEKSIKTGNILFDVYSTYCKDVRWVEEMKIEDRMNFILNSINQ